MEVQHHGFTLLENLVDPLDTLQDFPKALVPKVVAEFSINEMFADIVYSFPGGRSSSDGPPIVQGGRRS